MLKEERSFEQLKNNSCRMLNDYRIKVYIGKIIDILFTKIEIESRKFLKFLS